MARVIYVKHGEVRNFIVTDAAMNDLIRPTLYDAFSRDAAGQGAVGLCRHDHCRCGRPCVRRPAITWRSSESCRRWKRGDLIAILTAGAYGAVQSGTYNTRPLVPEVLVKDERFAIVRPRQSYEQLIGLDHLAEWQVR